eukprot:2713592-Pyramimonas_sp.AAC.1
MGPRSAVLGVADACGTPLPLGALPGAPYGATKRCFGCGRRMGSTWSSLWGHEALYWVGETHGGGRMGMRRDEEEETREPSLQTEDPTPQD